MGSVAFGGLGCISVPTEQHVPAQGMAVCIVTHSGVPISITGRVNNQGFVSLEGNT